MKNSKVLDTVILEKKFWRMKSKFLG